MIQLSLLQLDALKELGTMGAGHAASGLSVLLKTRVEISVSKVQLLALQDVADFLGGAEKPVSAIYLELVGEIKGSVVMIFPQESAMALINVLLGRKKSFSVSFDEYEESALKELGNISAAAYLGALADLTGYRISCSIPFLAGDMLGSVLNQILAPISAEGDHALLIETDFRIDKCSASGFFLLLPNIAGWENILKKLGA